VQRLVDAGTARGEAARRVSRETGVPRRALYAPAPQDPADDQDGGDAPPPDELDP
jgi:hypothetical protein